MGGNRSRNRRRDQRSSETTNLSALVGIVAPSATPSAPRTPARKGRRRPSTGSIANMSSPIQSIPLVLQPTRKRTRSRTPRHSPYEILLDLAEDISAMKPNRPRRKRGADAAVGPSESLSPDDVKHAGPLSVGDIIAQLSASDCSSDEDDDEEQGDTLVVEEVGESPDDAESSTCTDQRHKLRVTRQCPHTRSVDPEKESQTSDDGADVGARVAGPEEDHGEEEEDDDEAEEDDDEEEETSDEEEVTIFLALPGVPQPPPSRTTLLPKRRPKRFSPTSCTLVLDLDETLVAARGKDIVVRPHVVGLLQTARSLCCEIVLWTAGVHEHTQRVLAAIDTVCAPGQEIVWFDHLLCRSCRWYSEDRPNKDLSLLGRPLSNILLVDNSAASAALQPSNAILVEDYTGAKYDESLANLQEVLHAVAEGLRQERAVPDILIDSPSLMQRPLTLPHSRGKTFFLLQNGSSPTRIYGACKVDGF